MVSLLALRMVVTMAYIDRVIDPVLFRNHPDSLCRLCLLHECCQLRTEHRLPCVLKDYRHGRVEQGRGRKRRP